MSFHIPLSTPDVGASEEAALLRAFRSGWVAPAGPELAAFEAELAVATGRNHAVAMSSGTAALHLSLVSHGIGTGDIVLCSTFTFAATANAIVYTGAQPYFIDSDASGNMDPTLLEQAFAVLAAIGKRAAAVVVVDLLGKVADYAQICALAGDFGVPVISDAAESLGASRDGQPAGSFGSCAIVSFNGNKIITSSGGGAFLCDDTTLAERVRYLATQARQPVVHYEHTEIGYNYRLSNLLAAIGRAQLERLPEMLTKRRRVREAYRELSELLPGVEIFGGADEEDNCWLSALVVTPGSANFTATALSENLRQAGIETRPLWKPMHIQPVFCDEKCYPRLVNDTSEGLFERGLALPSGSNMTTWQITEVVDHISAFARRDALVR